ncbi:MAG: PAS domain-containing protein [Zoogloeaceae bacterium]|jgi:PAS domain S-box-containing protein|nr:PAS domain-containing protein [Zoogloeaceae bacterium]
MGNSRRGKQWRKTGIKQRFRPGLLVNVAVLACALVIFYQIWLARVEQTLAQSEQRLQLMRSSINHALTDGVAANIRLLRVEAERELAHDDRYQPQHFITMLRAHADGFMTSHTPPGLPAEHASYLFGQGEIPSANSARALEMSDALALMPMMAEMQKLIPDVSWIHYTSRQGFTNLYPSPQPQQLEWDEAFANTLLTQLAPAQNPERAIRWLDAYIDPAGLGVMISLAAPIDDAKGNYRALVALDFTLATLKHFLHLPPPEFGDDYLLNQSGQVLLSSRKISNDRVRHIREVLPDRQDMLTDATMMLPSGRCAQYDNWYICNENLQDIPWRLVHIIDRTQVYTAVLKEMRAESAGLLLLCLLLAALELRRRTNRIMHLQNTRYYRIIENSEQGFWSLDLETHKFRASPRFNNLLGYAEDKLPLPGQDWRGQIFEEDVPRIRAALRDLLRRHKPFKQQIEFRVRSNTGAWRWLLAQGRLGDWDQHGRARIMSGSLTDITERREAEVALLLAKQEADRARQVAENANVAKSRFLAAASHDLRQPLQANSLFVSALARTSLDADQKRIVRHMALATQTLGELLDALLDISRLDAGVISPQLAPIELYDIFQRLDNEFASLALEKKLRFKLFFPAQPLVLLTDQHLLLGLLRNLVSNAIRYTDWGGILIGARPRGNNLLIQVWDTGIGIKEEFMPRIYEEFFQADNPQRDRNQGLGLGLSIARRMADLLGYRLLCQSRYGRGSLFEVTIPLNADGQRDVLAPSETGDNDDPDLSVLNGRHCILIDDDPLVVSALDVWLSNHGIKTHCFCDSDKALLDPAIATTDFFITDFRMPGETNGIDFLNAVHNRLQHPVCAIILTGDASVEQLDAFANLCWPVLHKPIQPDLLLETLARLWHKQHPYTYEPGN